MAEDDVDFAVAAYHDEGQWQVVELDPRLGEDVDELSDALGRFPSDVGVLGMVSMNDDFFVIVRRSGTTERPILRLEGSESREDAEALRGYLVGRTEAAGGRA